MLPGDAVHSLCPQRESEIAESEHYATPPPLAPRALSRRRFLGATTVAATAATLALDQTAAAQQLQSAIVGEHNASATDRGPGNSALCGINPNGFEPPPTDHGIVRTFWSSFSAMHRRVEDGSWSRQHLGISPETLTAIPHANLALLTA